MKKDQAAIKDRQSMFFAKGHLARVRSEKKRAEREMLAKTSLKDLIK